MNLKTRIFIGILILTLIVTLCAYYASEYENNLEHPSYGTILSDYPEGEVVRVYGTVVRNYPGGYEIQQIYNDQLVTMQVDSESPVALGDRVDLLGVLGPEYTIISVQKIYVNEMWKYYFILLRSFLVLLFMVFIFNRYWSFDFKKLVFRRR
jgi:hypothetical protein